jgi:hypothetical protein
MVKQTLMLKSFFMGYLLRNHCPTYPD